MGEDKSYEIDQILQEMRSDYWRNLEAADESSGGARAEFLIVHCSSRRYGLPAVNCREVLKLPHLVRVPRLPEHLRGIFNLRGEIVAVTDLSPLLGQVRQELRADCRLVVVEEGQFKTALLVEAVEGLVSIEEEQIEPLAEGAGKGARDLISGKVVQGENVLVLLGLEKLLDRPEMIVDQKQQL